MRANARPPRISSVTRARYSAPPSPPFGETPTSSVNMATDAGSRMSRSSMRTRRTSGSAGTSGARDVAITGCRSRTARAGPQCGSSRSHSGPTISAGPTMDEQRRPCQRARSAKTRSASGVAAAGTRFAPA